MLPGYLERLQGFWLKGACRPKVKQNAAAAGSGGGSASLSINQFLSAFLLLAAGMSIAIFFFGVESVYFLYLRRWVVSDDTANKFFSLLSSVSKSCHSELVKSVLDRSFSNM
jgi:hypothetical protein